LLGDCLVCPRQLHPNETAVYPPSFGASFSLPAPAREKQAMSDLNRRQLVDAPDLSPGNPQPVPSPCIQVCRIDADSGWCDGCQRSLDEIAAWSTMDEAARRAVWRQVLVRRDAD
jgi:predicted Fe-S protein YdhL (DUF1289 family)